MLPFSTPPVFRFLSFCFLITIHNSRQVENILKMFFLYKSARHLLCTIFITLVLTFNAQWICSPSVELCLTVKLRLLLFLHTWGFPRSRSWFHIWHLIIMQATCIQSFPLARWIKKKGWKKENRPKHLSQNLTAVLFWTHKIKLCAIPLSCSL